MNFNEYQKKAMETYFHTKGIPEIVFSALCIADEAGEVAGAVKKLYRDSGGEMTDEWRKRIMGEAGDVLWYITMLAQSLDVSMEDIAKMNIKKLSDRKNRDVLKGDGDNR